MKRYHIVLAAILSLGLLPVLGCEMPEEVPPEPPPMEEEQPPAPEPEAEPEPGPDMPGAPEER